MREENKLIAQTGLPYKQSSYGGSTHARGYIDGPVEWLVPAISVPASDECMDLGLFYFYLYLDVNPNSSGDIVDTLCTSKEFGKQVDANPVHMYPVSLSHKYLPVHPLFHFRCSVIKEPHADCVNLFHCIGKE